MSLEIIQVITLLLSLAGFGLQPNPKAPTADQALHYALPDADVIVQLDAGSIIPANYKVLTNLPNQPQIKASPELSRMVRKAIGEVEGARSLAKLASGIDVATDVNDGTLFLQFVPNRDPNVVAVAHGKFSTAIIDRIAGTAKLPVARVGTAMMVEIEGGAIAVTKAGTLLAGRPAQLVKDRLADTWKPPTRAAGTNLAFAAEAINAKPVFSIIVTPSAALRKEASAELGKTAVSDLIARGKQAAISLYHDGIGWTWIDRTKAGIESVALMSEGMMDLFKASQVAPRGFAKLLLGGLESYKGTNKQIDEVLRRKADVMKLITAYTGDGNFRVQIDKDPKTMKVTARATARSLSEVVPFGVVVPFAVIGYFVGAQSGGMAMPPPPPARAAPVTAPAARPGRRPAAKQP
ncbi:MAG: hypothetical protein AB7O24_07940 [Kofleriaceae bacterium]